MATQTQTLSTVPMVANIEHYGGDTLYVRVEVPAEFTTGKQWDAQVRRTRDAVDIDAVFDFQPGDTPDVMFMILPADVVSGLIEDYGVEARVNGTMTIRYLGEYDCQISEAGQDPVTTLVQGTLTLFPDVTRR